MMLSQKNSPVMPNADFDCSDSVMPNADFECSDSVMPTKTPLLEDEIRDEDGLLECEPPYQCRTCGKVFAIPARLQRHYRIHTGEKPFKCDFCDKMFSVKENLNVHRRIHTKERPYQCSVCSRAFEHSGKLHRHMRTHTGERPHKCELCGKTFVQSGQLVIHMRAHTGEKPYTCDYCQKGFTCSKQLKVHIRTHTGEKPYECDICGKTFGYNHVLKMHKMSHLGEKLYKCTLCEEFFSSRKALDRHIKNHNQESRRTWEHEQECHQQPNEDFASVDANHPEGVSEPPQVSQFLHHSIIHGGQKPSRKSQELLAPKEHHISPLHPQLLSPINLPLTPPRSPECSGLSPAVPISIPILTTVASSSMYSKEFLAKFYRRNPGDSNTNPRQLPFQFQEMAFFTTITGERLACPADLLVRLQGPGNDLDSNPLKLQQEFEETLRAQRELRERLKLEESRREREKLFCDSVLKVLKSCIGKEKLRYLGYPQATIDEVIRNTLKLMNTEACWEPSLEPMDRIKVNLRLLLECCIPDKALWDKFGWKGKSIEDIVSEFLNQCG